MEDTSDHHDPGALRQRLRSQVADVAAIEDEHPRIGGDPRGELAVADVDAEDPRGPTLEENVREASGRRAHVERYPAGGVDTEGVERVASLSPPRET